MPYNEHVADELPPKTVSTHRLPFGILLGIHIVVAVALGFFIDDGAPNFPLAIYIGLFFSQTSLLGFVVGLANLPIWARLIALVVGAIYLCILFFTNFGAPYEAELLVLVLLPIVGTAIMSLAIRAWLARLVDTTKLGRPVVAEGLQFSIRHLLILTLIVACLMGLGRLLFPWFENLYLIGDFVAYSVCFIAVGISSLWAMLGISHVVGRIAVVLALAVASAFIPAFVVGRGDFAFWAVMMLAESIFVLASLFVARWLGYRLIRVAELRLAA